MTGPAELVVYEPDGNPCAHRAGCASPARHDRSAPVRPTTEAEIRERGWPRCRALTCWPVAQEETR